MQGARQEAVATAADVLVALESEVTSMRCLNRLRPIRQAAGSTAGGQDFRERFDAAEQALAVACSLPRRDAPFANDESLGTGDRTLAGTQHRLACRHPSGRIRTANPT
jgi:hypothetical protein